MNELHRDFLVTYDPSYFEEHLDSSEFEESIPSITPRNSNQYLLTKENKKVTKKQKDNLNKKIHRNYEYNKNQHSSLGATVQTNTMLDRRNGTIELAEGNGYTNRNFNQGNIINHKQKTLIRHKVIPCLSSMFGRSVSKLSHPKENQPKNVRKDNSCQVESSNDERRRKKKKVDRQHKINVHPVHPFEGLQCGAKTFDATQNTQTIPHDNNKSLRRVYSNMLCNVALTEYEMEEIDKIKRRKYKKLLQSALKEAKLKYSTNRKHHCQQFPSKQSLYHVFNSNQGQYSVAKAQRQRLNNPMDSKLSITSSGFWDYLLDKFNKKTNSRKPNPFKQCQRKDFALQCCPVNFGANNYGPYTEFGHNHQGINYFQEEDDDCPCSDTNINYPRYTCKDFAHNFDSSTLTERRKQTASKNTQCECCPPKRRQAIPKQSSPAPVQEPENICGCQYPHDQIADVVANKYNGEVLCIHNPPCILINGCLNLTQPTEDSQVNAWPVVETKKDSLFRSPKTVKNPKRNQEKFSQYHAQCVEVRQCQAPEKKSEKIIQSICNHKPPCEVVRCCHKPKYDPKLQNSCIHVPMCPKVHECLMQRGRENKTLDTCEHEPKCPEVPLCTRKHVELTAKDSVGTQVKPQTKTFCRHDPPCILIPKCLGDAVQETYISYEAIPNCVHQPLCDLIPACCRKPTKGMVSAYCQYPNGCRVV